MTSKHPYIKLVHSADKETHEQKGIDGPVQYSMFPESNPYTLVYVTPNLLDETEFLDIFNEVHPRYVLDMRKVPRFDIGTLNRQKIFSTYFSDKLTYRDLDLANEGISERCSLISKKFSEWLDNYMSEIKSSDSFVGPIVIFIDSSCRNTNELFSIVNEIKDKTKTKKDWEVFSVN